MSGKEVIVYTTRVCPFCHAAKKLLSDKKIEFKEVDVTTDAQMREKLVEMSGGRTTVPQIFVDGKSIGGYDELAAIYNAGKEL